MSIHQFIVRYGYLAVFAFVAVESLGVPIPGETVLIAAGTYAGATHALSPWGIFAVAAAAAIIGDTIGYWIGNKGGYRLLRRWGRYVRFDEAKIKVARYLFDRHGGKVVFFGRFISILRTYAAFLAGTTKMRYRRFLLYNAAGGITWAAIYTTVSYFAGATLSRISSTLNLALGGVAVIVVIVVIVYTRRNIERLILKAEMAYPGPLEE
jgi:membrane protein DedA with SNARE-associated domain